MSRYRDVDGGRGGLFAILTGVLTSAFSMLIGLQGLLNLQYLPAEFTDLVQNTASFFGVSVPQASMIFLASGLVWGPLFFALGRATTT